MRLAPFTLPLLLADALAGVAQLGDQTGLLVSPLPPTNVSARELLGLPERFTGAELRRARLRLPTDGLRPAVACVR